MSLFKDFINFLLDPVKLINRHENKLNLNQILKLFLQIFVKIIFFYFIILYLFTMLNDDFNSFFFKNVSLGRKEGYSIIQGLLMAPILEELAFRLGLSLKKNFLIIASSLQLFYVLICIERLNESNWFVYVFILLVFFLALMSYVNEKTLVQLKKNYNFYFYYSLLFFSTMHLFNYTYDSIYQYFYFPLLTFPQFIFGSLLSYIRLRNTIVFSIVFHFLYNFAIFLLRILFD